MSYRIKWWYRPDGFRWGGVTASFDGTERAIRTISELRELFRYDLDLEFVLQKQQGEGETGWVDIASPGGHINKREGRFRLTFDEYRRLVVEARKALGKPAALDEALVAVGIDAFIALLDGDEIEIDGEVYVLTRDYYREWADLVLRTALREG